MTQLKRIKYISEFTTPMSPKDIDKLVDQSIHNNAEMEITGILIASGQMFFQVIEGPEHHVDGLYDLIQKDSRHKNVLLLNSEAGIVSRIFPDWSMKKVNLDTGSAMQMEPLKAILEIILENRCRMERLVGVLERSIWEKFSDSI